tara:strand:+ start:4707 stop:4865 length:159 start_codon:yes stop_codon:yes gene_type:complete
MEAVTKIGSAHGCAVRTGALKVIVQTRLENNMGSLSFGCSKESNSPKGENTA